MQTSPPAAQHYKTCSWKDRSKTASLGVACVLPLRADSLAPSPIVLGGQCRGPPHARHFGPVSHSSTRQDHSTLSSCSSIPRILPTLMSMPPPPTPDPQSPESSLRLGRAGSRAPAIQQLLRPARALCRSHPSSFSTQSQCLRHDGHPTLLRAAQKPNWGTLGACLGNSERQEAKDTGGAAVQHSSCGSRGSQERGRRQRHPRRVCCRVGPQMRGGSGAGGSADCI